MRSRKCSLQRNKPKLLSHECSYPLQATCASIDAPPCASPEAGGAQIYRHKFVVTGWKSLARFPVRRYSVPHSLKSDRIISRGTKDTRHRHICVSSRREVLIRTDLSRSCNSTFIEHCKGVSREGSTPWLIRAGVSERRSTNANLS